jgi:hypothetical protein
MGHQHGTVRNTNIMCLVLECSSSSHIATFLATAVVLSFDVCSAAVSLTPGRSAPRGLFRIPLHAASGYRIILLFAVFMEASSCIARSRRLAARFS